MQLLPILFVTCLVAFSSAEPLFRFFTDNDSELMMEKRASRVRELLGKRNVGYNYPKRGRELFGKRSALAQKRRPRELFGKRSAPAIVDEQNEDSAALDYVYDEELLRALNGLKRERRARELLG